MTGEDGNLINRRAVVFASLLAISACARRIWNASHRLSSSFQFPSRIAYWPFQLSWTMALRSALFVACAIKS